MNDGRLGGIWQRIYEEDPIGGEEADRSTLVLWFQTPCGMYIDIRLPKTIIQCSEKRPTALNANGLSRSFKGSLDQDQQQWETLLSQKSFAGYSQVTREEALMKTALEGDPVLRQLAKQDPPCRVFWQRYIDLQPPSDNLDIGICAGYPTFIDGSFYLRETGDDASYAEGWLRLATTNNGPFWAMELLDDDERQGYWIRIGNRFAYAVGYPTNGILKDPTFKGMTTLAVVQKLLENKTYEMDRILDELASYVAVVGEITSTGWEIQHGTNPELVGCQLVGDLDNNLCCSTATIDSEGKIQQQLKNGCCRVWKIVENTVSQNLFS